MRLPMKDGEVDHKEFSKMVDEFLLNGFNYFDTAHGYLGGKSETALKIGLTRDAVCRMSIKEKGERKVFHLYLFVL